LWCRNYPEESKPPQYRQSIWSDERRRERG
jgi:hypothetical protein